MLGNEVTATEAMIPAAHRGEALFSPAVLARAVSRMRNPCIRVSGGPCRYVIAPSRWRLKVLDMVHELRTNSNNRGSGDETTPRTGAAFRARLHAASIRKPLIHRMALRYGFGSEIEAMALEVLRRTRLNPAA
jgi:hypothetical protein